jgi:nitroimidazol reductase NimA-like FMN-containing flavoprotein (pyridoxamine 5'-phosphate oxidase superfamily)
MQDKTSPAGSDDSLLQWMIDFFQARSALILGTCRDNLPHCTIMIFVFAPQEDAFYLLTPKNSTKHENIRANERVSLLVSDHGERGGVFDSSSSAVTISGRARELDAYERPGVEELFLHRYPQLEQFIRSPDTVHIRILCESAVVVRKFREVTHYRW